MHFRCVRKALLACLCCPLPPRPWSRPLGKAPDCHSLPPNAPTPWPCPGPVPPHLPPVQGGLQRPDTLLGGVRLPLLGAATAGRLRRTWLLQPAGSRTSAGAAELEMELSWCPLPPLPP